jgi:fido (protein-threonine AMPylation protein)
VDAIDLQGTPYLLDATMAAPVGQALGELQERVEMLRSTGRLSDETLEFYYGQTRFEQIAESNAIEGSTLSVGETELAVIKGITISGHDPAYSRDAQALARALDHLAELARSTTPTRIEEVKSLHEFILGDRPGAGQFRTEEVRISGSAHHPPRNWRDILAGMEQWEGWPRSHPSAPPVLRAAVLHAWLVHIHPFLDGNGRTARAIGNLELIRAGYPPLILRARKDRTRYLEALRRSDEGDLSLFFDLIVDRTGDALRDLERAAARGQGYSPEMVLIRKAQERQLAIWNAAVELLVQMVTAHLHEQLDPQNGRVQVYPYRDSLSLDDYLALCERQTISRSWAFRIVCEVPGLLPLRRLAWTGFRSPELAAELPQSAPPGPSLFWSEPNPGGYPPWSRLEQGGPGGDELTLLGDRWWVRSNERCRSLSPLELAEAIASDVVRSIAS